LQEMAAAKWGYVTRLVNDPASLRLGSGVRSPLLGDFIVARVAAIGEHECLEDVHGRRMKMFPGDLIVGAYGNRYATDFYEGYLPKPGDAVHLLTSGGLIGTVASSHTSKGAPTELEVIGPLTDAEGKPLNCDDIAVVPSPSRRPELGTIVVVGSSMNAGKTTSTSGIIHGLHRAGYRVGAGKVTGSGSGKDHWAYVDAGAAPVSDFLDFGMPSTFGYPTERLVSTMSAIRDRLVAQGAEAVVLEIADGVLQEETRALAAQLPEFADAVVLAVGDALGASAGIDVLRGLGVSVRAISGLVTASPLAVREVEEVTGLTVLNPYELAGGAALSLLGLQAPADADELVADLPHWHGTPA
jgi:hypothetical protein